MSSFPPPIESLTLRVTTSVYPNAQPFEQTISSANMGSNSIPIHNTSLTSAFNTQPPGTIFNASIVTTYSEFPSSDTISTPSLLIFVPNPLVLSNFGPFSYNYVSGGVGTFTLPQPSSNSNSPGAFTYSVVDTNGVVSVSTNVVTILSAGTTTIRATQAAAGGYASAYVDASVTINPIAPTFSNGGVFTIANKNFGAAPFTPTYLTSNSSGAFTYTSITPSVASVHPTTGVVTIVSSGTTTIRATQAAAGNYTSAYVQATLLVELSVSSLTWSNITKLVSTSAFPLIGDLEPSSNVSLSYGDIWNFLGTDIDGEAARDYSGKSVSLSADGTIVAIGAFGNSNSSGHVRVYKYDLTKTTAVTDQSSSDFGPVGWRRLGQDIDGEAADDNSGRSVSLSADGTIVAIGANGNDGNGNSNSSGHVRVYSYDVTKTTAVTDQSSPDFGPVGWRRLGQEIAAEAAEDNSGWSVSLSADGTIVAIGATGNGSYSGHVRVYSYDPTKNTAVTDQSSPDFGPVGWRRLGQDIDGEDLYDYSGTSVSLSADGTIVAIGAWANDGNGNNSGHVRVYKYNVNKTTAVTDQSSPDFGPVGWRRLGQDIDGEAAGDRSGYSVSLSADGTIVAIGAWANGSSYSYIGHVRVYSYDPTKTTAVTDQSSPDFGPIGWRRLGTDIDGEAAGDYSGYSVSLSSDGTIVAIGAIGNSANSGHVRVLKIDSFGNFTYTSDTPAVADVYGNIVLLRSIGESTLTARQSATSNSLSGTVDATLTVSLSPTLALVANYPFDSDGNDASTNNNHLTNHNTVTFDTVNFRRGTGAALFDGSNYFEIANDGRFSPDNFTVACWIKPLSSVGNYQAIASCRSGFSPNVLGWMIYIAPDNSLQFWTGNYPSWSGPGIHLYSDFGNLNVWVHLAFTFTKSTGSLKFFINGALYSTVSRSYANTTINNLRIGAGANESNALFFLRNGTLLDDFRFYDATLSASQVNDIYSN